MIASDLVSELDLLALDSGVREDFGATSQELALKREVAVNSWLRLQLEAANLPPAKHLIRRALTYAYAYRGAQFVDVTDSSKDPSTDLFINSLIATPSTDAIYVGMDEPFRGLVLGLTDTVNAIAVTSSLTYWNGRWSTPASWTDETSVSNTPFAAGGRVRWMTPDDWIPRQVNGQLAYWMRIQVNSTVTNPTTVRQILALARSRFTDPAAHYALHLIYREAVASERGDWEKKSALFKEAADKALALALVQGRDEFDWDEDNATEPNEANSVNPQPLQGFVWERG